MNKRLFTIKEYCLFLVRLACMMLASIPARIANWATDRLNKSYYNVK